jgi:hypothetical protein
MLGTSEYWKRILLKQASKMKYNKTALHLLYKKLSNCEKGQDSVVSIATYYRLGSPGNVSW